MWILWNLYRMNDLKSDVQVEFIIVVENRNQNIVIDEIKFKIW